MSLLDKKISCFNCHKELDLSTGTRIMRNEECPSCYASLHSCKMCEFYDRTAYNECREPSADRIVEKDKANFCDYFILSSGGSGSNSDEAKSAVDALFKS